MTQPPSDDYAGAARLTPEDERAIIDATIAYCWAIDRRAWNELEAIFLEDAYVDYSFVPAFNGVEPVKAFVAKSLERLDATQHMISNHQVAADGDGARSRCYLHAQHTLRGCEGGENYVVAGIYRDRWKRTDAGWRIAERHLEMLWTEGNASVLRGRRD